MIREYRENDLIDVITLFTRSVHEVAKRDYTSEQLNAWAPENADISAWKKRLSQETVFVFEKENKILGFIRLEQNGYLDLLYVHPEFQRQGIAKNLLNHALSWAENHGISEFTSDVSITAKPFFESIGFYSVALQTIQCRGVLLNNFRMKFSSAQKYSG